MIRHQHTRAQLRYGSDLAGGERAIVAPLLPAPKEAGRSRSYAWPMRHRL
jgi:hypothetical protein